MGGLFVALAGRRTVAVHLKGLPNEEAREQAAAVLQTLPQELRTAPVEGEPPPLTADPARVRQACAIGDAHPTRLLFRCRSADLPWRQVRATSRLFK
jgi:hypothetical protein